MSEKPETTFQRRVLKWLREQPRVCCTKVNQVSIRGDSDVFLCWRGRFVVLELKKSMYDEATPLQQHKQRRVRRCGGVALVCCPENFDDVKRQLEAL